MARLSTTTNPTNLIEIDRSDVVIDVVKLDGAEQAIIRELKLAAYDLAETCVCTLICRAGNTTARFELGTVLSPALGPYALTELDPGQLKKFRFLVRTPNGARLVASAEGIRPKGDGDMESLLPIVPTELGQRLWRVTIDEDGATLECNARIFANGESAQSFAPFRDLVLPEAFRQVLIYLADEPDRMDVEGSAWSEWRAWMPLLGIEPTIPDEKDARALWVEGAVGAFCDKFAFTSDLDAFILAAEHS